MQSSPWANQNQRGLTLADIRAHPEKIAMTASIRDGLQSAIRDGENALRPIDSHQINAPAPNGSALQIANRMDAALPAQQNAATMQMVRNGTLESRVNIHRGHRAPTLSFGANIGQFLLPDPDIIAHGYGQHSLNVAKSDKMMPAHLRPDYSEHVLAKGWTGRECQDLMREQEKAQSPSRMMRGNASYQSNSLVPQTSGRDSHYASTLRARVDSYNRPAGAQNIWPTGVAPAGMPSPADPTRANLVRLPNAVHTTPIAAQRDAQAAGVPPAAAARGDGRDVNGNPLTPYTDPHGFTFAYRHRTDFRTPNFYPARDVGADKLFLENASRFQPEYQADLMDRVSASMVDRFPEPLESRENLMRDYMRDFTCSRDQYMKPRTGPSVVNPSRPAPKQTGYPHHY